MIRWATVSEVVELETAFEEPESEVLELFEVLELGTLFQEVLEAKLEDVVESDVVELESALASDVVEVLESGT